MRDGCGSHVDPRTDGRADDVWEPRPEGSGSCPSEAAQGQAPCPRPYRNAPGRTARTSPASTSTAQASGSARARHQLTISIGAMLATQRLIAIPWLTTATVPAVD